MRYHLKIIARAERDLDAIFSRDFEMIRKKVLSLSENPRPFGRRKPTIDEGYRIRAGDFRILYRVDDRSKEVIIYRIKHRKDAYR